MLDIGNITDVFVLGSAYSLIAIGLTTVYGLLRILHIAHAGVFTLGAYVSLYMLSVVSSFWLALTVAIVVSGLFGVLIYRTVYYYMLSQPRIVPLIASMGIFILLEDLYRLIAGPYRKSFPVSISFPQLEAQGVLITSEQLLIIVLTVVALIIVYVITNRTKLGLAWQASAQDMTMAEALGVNTNRAVALNFFMGSALAGLAGVLMALYRNSIFPTMGAVVSYKAFVIVVLGGFGSVRGSVIAAFIIAFVETALSVTQAISFPRDAVAFLAMILILMFRPEGLFKRGT